jgi:UDP-N-acetylmuramyl pentapeptide phosphotransferase/UDP-N-acetylglucosamine-1-phosphate transferase
VSVDEAMTALAAALAGAGLARGLAELRLQAPPDRLMRTNVKGRCVPAVLGGPNAIAALVVLAVLQVGAAGGWAAARTDEVGVAVAVVVVVMALAGAFDDLRGDERARGFKGHLRAAASLSLTGGLVKLAAGGVAGVAAGLLVAGGAEIAVTVEIALLVALMANLVNLTDRAPGRAGKVSVVVAVPLVAFGDPDWAIAAAGLLGALAGCLPLDLSERAMLGDAGANPLGAVLGLGLGVALDPAGRLAAILLLLLLNAASERWSFSRAIDRVGWLRALDDIGRTDSSRNARD